MRIYIDDCFPANTREELHRQVLAAADAAWDDEVVERATELIRDEARRALPQGLRGDEPIPARFLADVFPAWPRKDS